MYTVIEYPAFQKQADKLWTEEERLAFIAYIAQNPLAGDVIPNANGARKVRWRLQGRGKSGGVRVIYFNFLDDGQIVLVAIYSKSERENLPAHQIKGRR